MKLSGFLMELVEEETLKITGLLGDQLFCHVFSMF